MSRSRTELGSVKCRISERLYHWAIQAHTGIHNWNRAYIYRRTSSEKKALCLNVPSCKSRERRLSRGKWGKANEPITLQEARLHCGCNVPDWESCVHYWCHWLLIGVVQIICLIHKLIPGIKHQSSQAKVILKQEEDGTPSRQQCKRNTIMIYHHIQSKNSDSLFGHTAF